MPAPGQPRVGWSRVHLKNHRVRPAMKQFVFHLSISPKQYLAYYRGTIKHVVVPCSTGATIQFPAGLLTPFVTESGIQGRFRLTCDDNHKGSRLQRLAG